MPRRTELRQQASIYRRLAGMPTEGGHEEDRILRAVADKLEREAAELDELSSRPSPGPALNGNLK
jgi:hypothetical protein